MGNCHFVSLTKAFRCCSLKSQIIHCIVLYLDFQTATSECLGQANKMTVRSPARGDHNSVKRARIFKPPLFSSSTQRPSHSQQANQQTISQPLRTVLPAHQTGCTAKTRDRKVSVSPHVLFVDTPY